MSIYEQGFKAYHHGDELAECPHRAFLDASEWRDGWLDADRLTRAYNRGYMAYLSGIKLKDGPTIKENKTSWVDGWKAARKEHGGRKK